MKFFSAIIVLFSRLVTTEASTCSFCAGADVDEAMEIPYTDGVTCGMAILAASVYEEGTDDCSALHAGESICCPEAVLSDRTTASGYSPRYVHVDTFHSRCFQDARSLLQPF